MQESRFSKYVQGNPSTTTSTTSRFSKYVNPTEEPEQDVAPSTFQRIANAIPQPIKTTVGTVFDYLGRPGAATAGAINALQTGEPVLERVGQNLSGERRDDFDDVLEDAGMEDSFGRRALGFAGDVVVDPLNLTPAGWIGKLGKATKATDALGAAKSAVSKFDTKLGGHGKDVVDDLGKKLVPQYGLPADYARDRRMINASLSTIEDRKVKELRERFAGTTPEMRGEIALDIEKGAGRTDVHDQFVQQHRGVEDTYHKRQVDAGMMKDEAFVPDHVRHDYVDKIYTDADRRRFLGSNLSKRNKNAISRQDHERTLEEAIDKGATGDLAKIQFRYEKEAERASQVGEFLQSTAREYGERLPAIATEGGDAAVEASKQARRAREMELFDQGYDFMDIPEGHPLFAKIGDVMLPKVIADDLDALRVPPAEMGKVGKAFNRLMQMWRTQATVLRPAHHMVNLSGNVFNAGVGGLVNPLRYWEAGTWSKMSPAAKFGNYTKAQADEFMEQTGLGRWNTSNLTSELGDVDNANALVRKLDLDATYGGNVPFSAKAANAAKHPVQLAKTVGSELENFSKRALFLDRLHKGDTLETAYEHTQKFLFDYGNLTDFEKRYMRNIFPFYTWMRKNVPLQAQMIAERPQAYAAVEKGKQAIEDVSRDENNYTPEAFRPEYLQELGAVQLPTEKGKPKQFWNPYLPYNDLNQLPIAGESVDNALGKLLSSTSPLIKIPAELAFNKNSFFGSPLYKEGMMLEDTQPLPASLEALPQSVKDLLFTKAQGSRKHEVPFLAKYALQQLPLGESAGKAAAAATADEPANPFALESFVTGFKRTQRTPQQESKDRRSAHTRKRTKDAERRKQAPVKKARVDSVRSILEGR